MKYSASYLLPLLSTLTIQSGFTQDFDSSLPPTPTMAGRLWTGALFLGAGLDRSRIMPSSSKPYSSSEDDSSFTFTVRLAPSNTGSYAESTTAGSTETTSSNDHSLATYNSGFPVASATTHIAMSSSDTGLLTSDPGLVVIASQKRAVDEELMEAVSYHDFERVEDCLNRGADPSYRQSTDQDDPNGFIQPITPLRLVMFRISDCLLNDEDLKEFYKIARCLLDHGADPRPAIKIAEERYGKYEDDSGGDSDVFMDIWRIVHNAGTQ
ncbi:hypothetical protein [Endozoicomonas sp. 8E]|uniref:hypothetical protein n=1 Tax=Endozoicomonas sp. 8E TaxID=3035692 RepID=UPI002938CFD6|nr:hypothetical protein [Endozoicomonas sp. 8E]WOG25743.1 hypothetical protein P6910_14270 [Endozoicomonas sp. 8E]